MLAIVFRLNADYGEAASGHIANILQCYKLHRLDAPSEKGGIIPIVGEVDLAAMLVIDLNGWLSIYNLSTQGSRAELIDRVKEAGGQSVVPALGKSEHPDTGLTSH